MAKYSNHGVFKAKKPKALAISYDQSTNSSRPSEMLAIQRDIRSELSGPSG